MNVLTISSQYYNPSLLSMGVTNLFITSECTYYLFSVWVEHEFKCDRYLAPHARYYIREMRIRAYTQLLESYRSLSLQHMARSFGVSTEFIDRYVDCCDC